MNPIFCRIGSKRYSAKEIIKYFPAHETYVEPFVGSGAVFFRKEKIRAEIWSLTYHIYMIAIIPFRR